jgi:clan AA aspartic protease (TIGR02281 family)
MRKGVVSIAFGLVLVLASDLLADGTYCIGRDKQGVYMETDKDGAWYIAKEHLRYFRVGEIGRYHTGDDAGGAYIELDRSRKFYIDLGAREKSERDIEEFNLKQGKLDVSAETKVEIKGNQVLVPVLLSCGKAETECVLLMDTGASRTVLHKEVAETLGIKRGGRGEIIVAGGKTLQTTVKKLNAITVGPITKTDLYVHIIEQQGPPVEYQGLLGMDFLRGLEYRIDFKKHVIQWKS